MKGEKMNNLTEINKVLNEHGASLEPDTATHKFRIRIKSSSSNSTYVVSQRENSQSWECGCPGWTMHMPRRNCKHLNEMLPVLEEIRKLILSSPKVLSSPKSAPTKITNTVAKKTKKTVAKATLPIAKKATAKVKTAKKPIAKKAVIKKKVAKKVTKRKSR